MKININTGKTWTPFAKIEKGEVFGIGDAVYMRLTDVRQEVYYNAWSFAANGLAHIDENEKVKITQRATLEVIL